MTEGSKTKYKGLLSNTLILGVGTFSSKLLVFLLMPLYTALLSASEFGIADIVTQTANLIIPLAAVGICDGIFRFALDASRANDEQSKKRVFTSGMTVIAVGGALTLCAIQALRAIDIFDGYVYVIAAYVICANIHSAEANFLRAMGKTAAFAVQGIINTVLTITLNIIFLVVCDMGAMGYVLSVVISDLTLGIGLFVFLRLYKFFSLRTLEKRTLLSMLKFSVPYIPTTMLWLVTAVSDRYIVTAYSGAAENGLYAAAYKLPTLLTLVCGVFIEAWQFFVVKDTTKKDREGYFSEVYKNYMGVIFMGASVIIAGSKILTRLLLADSYYSSWEYVPVLVIATLFSALVTFLGSVYFLEKKSVMSMLTAMSGALINVILNFMLIPERGAMGAAVATLISYAAVYAIRAYDTRFYVRFNMHTPRLLINTAVIIAQAFIMIMAPRYWKIAQLAIMLFVFAFNGRDIVMSVKPILGLIVGKIKKRREKSSKF